MIDVMHYCGLRVAELEVLKLEDFKINDDIAIAVREEKQGKYANVTMLNKHSKNLRQLF